MLSLPCLLLFLRGSAYPSNFWHFNSASAPGPGLTVNGIVTGGSLVMDGSSSYAIVNSSMIFSGEMTFIFRFFTNSTPPAYAPILDFGTPPANNYVSIFFDPAAGTIDFGVSSGPKYVYYVLCGMAYTPNQWNTVAIQLKSPGTVCWSGNSATVQCSTVTLTLPPSMVRTSQLIGKSNIGDPMWSGLLDFLWHINRVLSPAEMTVAAHTEGDLMANQWTFQSPSFLGSQVSLYGNPSVAGGTLDLHANSSQAAQINFTNFNIGGPFTIAARVRMDSYQSWSRVFDFSNNGVDDIYLGAVTTTDSAAVYVYRGNQAQTLTCGSFWQLGQWVDVFLRVGGTTFDLHRGTGLSCSTANGWEPNPLIRKQMWIGKSSNAGDGGWDGAFQYVALFPRYIDDVEMQYLSTVYQATNYNVGSQFAGWDSIFTGVGSPANNNGAVALNGLNTQYVQVSSNVVLTTPFSISTLLFLQVKGTNTTLFEFGNGINQDNVFLSQDGTSTNAIFRVIVSGVTRSLLCPNFFNVGSQTQVILVHDGSTASIYVNGNRSCSGSMPAVPNMTRTMQYIGRGIDPKKSGWQGYFDYFLLYNRALSSYEAMYNGLALDRNNILCNAPSFADNRINVGTCVNYGKQGTTCNLACNSPFLVWTSTPGVCTTIPNTESAAWTAQQITCIVTCPPLTPPVNTNVSCSGKYGPTNENATCIVGCGVGFLLIGSSTTQCTSAGGGTWTNPVGFCAVSNCPVLSFQYGTVSCTSTQYAGVCSFSCLPGFTQSGPSSATCLANGQWSNSTPTCTPVTCSPLSLLFGSVNCQDPYGVWTYGSTCNYACGANYSLSGPTTVSCTAAGQWNGSTPMCNLVTCPAQSDPVNGHVLCDQGVFTVTNGVTSQCSYTCVGGYGLSSTVVQVCRNTGAWSVPSPTCADINECLTPGMCPYGGQCLNTNGSYVCAPAFTSPIRSVNTGSSILPSSAGGKVKFSVYMGFGVTPSVNATSYTLSSSSNGVYTVCANITLTSLGGSLYNVSCVIGQGLGAGFTLSFPYSYLGAPLGVITSSSNFSYPTPTIDSNSLMVIGYPPASSVVISQSYTKGDLVTFTGTGFLADPTLMSVTYAAPGSASSSPCILLVAACNATNITCHTQPMGSGVNLVFTINANGVLVRGDDTYSMQNVPNVVSLTLSNMTTGCTQSGILLYDCPTPGNIPIVIVANYISENFLNGFVGGLTCDYLPPLLSQVVAPLLNYYFSCTLPPGTGFNRTVAVASDGKYSQAQALLSYAAPTIFNISGCSQLTSLTATNCPRQGGNALVVVGLNFGADSSSVAIGGTRCTSTTHDILTPHTRVICIMPPGFSLARQVQIFQAAGPFSQSVASVDYAQCAPGTFQQGSSTACGVCQPGQYSGVSGTFACVNCDSGRYAPQNTSSACLLCPLGTAQPSGGAWNCTVCGPGYYTDRVGSLSCQPCSPGTNASGYGSTGCSPCTAGRVAPTLGMDQCTACNAGYAAGAQQSQCLQCPVGTFSLPGASICESCQPGYFQSTAGSSFCNACVPGSYSATPGRVDCVPCESGYATNDTAATSCDICQPGSVSQRNLSFPVGPTQCTSCDPGYYMGIGGQAVCISCSPGFAANSSGSTMCNSCDPGYYQPSPSSANCQECPLGSYTALSGRPDCSLCGSGTHSDIPAATACAACGAGTFSTAATGTGVTQCSPCDPGTYVNTVGQVACFLCATGSAAPNSGSQGCTPCPAGTFAPAAGAQSCPVCLPGRYSGVPGQETCSPCDTGKYSPDHNSTSCVDCAQGYYQTLSGQSFCDVCPTGTFTSVMGQNSCSNCPVGKYNPTNGSNACIDCAVGTYQSLPSQSTCLGCTAGQYAAVKGRDVCNLCDPGAYNSQNYSSSCTPCSAGFYQSSSGSNTCAPCPSGYFTSASGQSTCVACSPGTYSQTSGQQACKDCSPGFYQKDRASSGCNPCSPGTSSPHGSSLCLLCQTGFITSAPGTAACSICQKNSVANSDQTRCDCNPGYYLDGDTCYTCPLGTACVAPGTVRSNIPVQNGYFLSDNTSLTYMKCLSPKSCVGGQCVNHRTGLLCSQCEGGYSMSQWTKQCAPCQTHRHSLAAMVLTILGLLLAVFLLYGYILYSAHSAYATATKAKRSKSVVGNGSQPGWTSASSNSLVNVPPALNHPATLSQLSHNRLSTHHLRQGSRLSTDGNGSGEIPVLQNSHGIIDRSTELYLGNVLKKDNRKHSGDNTYVLKIVVNFFQVASSLIGLPVAGAIAFPTYYMDFLSYFKFFNIDIIPWQNVTCLFPANFYIKMLVLTIVPAGLILALASGVLLATVLMDCRDMSDANVGRERRQNMRYLFVRGAIFTAFMLYPMISSSVLSHFVCIQVGPHSLLISDFNIPCHGPVWQRWTPYVVVMTIIYPIGIPALLFFLLYRNRLDLQSAFGSLGLGLLHESYRPLVWWFEIIVMMEKLTLTSLLQFLPLNIQLAGGIAVCAAFIITIVLVQPEIRLRNWRLHLLANVEILMLLLIWHFSYQSGITSAPVVLDALVSALFIGLTVGLVVYVFLDIIRILKTKVFHFFRAYTRRKMEKQRESTNKEGSGSITTNGVATTGGDSARPIRLSELMHQQQPQPHQQPQEV